MAESQKETLTAEVDEEHDDAIIGVAFRWSLLAIVVIASTVIGVIYFNWNPEETEVTGPSELVRPEVREVTVSPPTVLLVDMTEKAGIDFVHENGAAGQKLLPETMGGGCAIFDYDNDGDQDILLINSSVWEWDLNGAAAPPPAGLYRNGRQLEIHQCHIASWADRVDLWHGLRRWRF